MYKAIVICLSDPALIQSRVGNNPIEVQAWADKHRKPGRLVLFSELIDADHDGVSIQGTYTWRWLFNW